MSILDLPLTGWLPFGSVFHVIQVSILVEVLQGSSEKDVHKMFISILPHYIMQPGIIHCAY